jgi:hypothetical protein
MLAPGLRSPPQGQALAQAEGPATNVFACAAPRIVGPQRAGGSDSKGLRREVIELRDRCFKNGDQAGGNRGRVGRAGLAGSLEMAGDRGETLEAEHACAARKSVCRLAEPGIDASF